MDECFFNNQKIIAIDIANLTKDNDEIKKLVQTFINLDIRETLKEFENNYKLTLLDRHKSLIEIAFNMRKKFYVDSNAKFEKSLNSINQFENCKTY